MARRILSSYRRALYALVCSLELVLAACSGGGDATAPDPGPPAQDPPPVQGPPPAQDPPPGPTQPPEQPPPSQPPPGPNAGIAGTYVLIGINSSQPGQLVMLSNPDGIVIGLYRFDAGTQLTLEASQTFTLDIQYSDEKGEYGIPDQGEFVNASPPADVVGLTFTSTVYGDKFTGAAGQGLVGIKYDFDGDGRLDTVFQFERVGG